MDEAEREVISLNSHAISLYGRGQYEEAIKYAIRAASLAREVFGENHPNLASILNNLAASYHSFGNYPAAEQAFKEVLKIYRAVSGEQSEEFAKALNNLAALYYSLGDYAASGPLYRHALTIYRAVYGERHPLFAKTLNNLAVLYDALGNYVASEPLYRQALDIYRVTVGEQHPDYIESLDNLGNLYRLQGRYSEAESLCTQALKSRRDVLGQQHPHFAQSLTNVALIYKTSGDYISAEPLYKQALEIYRVTFGEQHPQFAQVLNNLATLYFSLGEYDSAERLYKQTLEILHAILGEEHPQVAVVLNNLAAVYQYKGDYLRAEESHKDALRIQRVVLGERHPGVGSSLNNLAELYRELGRYADAEQLYRRALEIFSGTFDGWHPSFADTLNNFAGLQHSLGRYGSAEQLYKQALEIYRVALGEQHPLFARYLNNLAEVYRETGRYDDARPLCEQALQIYRIALGEQHPDFAQSLNNLALLYYSSGDYAAAEPLYKQALEVRQSVLGEHHPDVAQAVHNLMLLFAATMRWAEAMKMMERVLVIDDYRIGQIFSISSESQRAAFLDTIRFRLQLFFSLITRSPYASSESVRLALSIVLRRKAIEAEALSIQRDAVLGGKYPEAAPKLLEVSRLRAQIAEKSLGGPGKEGLMAHRETLAEWNARRQQLEAEIARQVPEMNVELKLRTINHKAVATGLPSGATLVEFVRHRVFDFEAQAWGAERYLAFVMHAGEPESAEMIDLGRAEPIDRMISAFRDLIVAEALDKARGLGTAPVRRVTSQEVGIQLCEAIFNPLLTVIGDRKRLMISPDGDLTRLPFEVLPTDDGRRLIDEYLISYLSSGRDVGRFSFKSNRKSARSLVAVDPDFDLRAGDSRTKAAADAGRRSRDFTPNATGMFPRLPGTRLEGENIAAMLDAELWTEGAVLDARLRRCKSPRILHLATHGFFLEDRKRDPEDERPELGPTSFPEGGRRRLWDARFENPLLRSGLTLAGVNTWLEKGELMGEAEDGLLTAEDVSGLDLLDTELVVLSACETGLGEVRVGEGVFGLQRAFVLAGTKTLVMSLWEVPDEQTRELMEDFYSRILGADGQPPQPRAEALREAQLAIKAKHPEPFYWGAFICQGYDGPLV